MIILENINLAQYTTFKIGGPARFFCVVKDEKDVVEAVNFAKSKKIKIMPLGGGSNILVSDNGFDGLIIKNEIMGINLLENGSEVIVSSGAGEIWDELVSFSVKNNFYGLENLSFIPGTVGAAPVQNIGAYGVEVGNFVHNIRAYDIDKSEFVLLSKDDCRFGYRNSLFKYYKHRYIIVKVDFVLNKKKKIDITYKDLKDYFKDKSCESIGLPELRNAVIEIRKAKLPDWKKWGTAGSYFKNPIITDEHFGELKNKYPELPGFVESNGMVKVSLGWILDKVCNARGVNFRRASTYDKQALVIVADQGATAEEVVNLANKLMDVVKEKTGIIIESEVEWVV